MLNTEDASRVDNDKSFFIFIFHYPFKPVLWDNDFTVPGKKTLGNRHDFSGSLR